MSQPANLQTAFPQGPIADRAGNITLQWQRFMLVSYNRTGGAPGIDMAYQVTQITVALNTAQAAGKAAAQAEVDAQTGITAAAAAQATGAAALGVANAAATTAGTALTTAQAAETEAQSAMAATQDVLIMALLTSSSLAAQAVQFQQDAALMAAVSLAWPSRQ